MDQKKFYTVFHFISERSQESAIPEGFFDDPKVDAKVNMPLAFCIIWCTVEPPNKGHVGTRSFVLYREVSFIRRLKCTGIIGIGTSRFVLYREVSFIRSVLYRRFHCNGHSMTQ